MEQTEGVEFADEVSQQVKEVIEFVRKVNLAHANLIYRPSGVRTGSSGMRELRAARQPAGNGKVAKQVFLRIEPRPRK